MFVRRILVVLVVLISLKNGATQNVDPALVEFQSLSKKETSTQIKTSTIQVIETFIKGKFKQEIVRLYNFLPRSHQCDILNKLVNKTNCSGIYINKVLLKNNVIQPSKGTGCQATHTNFACKGTNATKIVLKAFWDEMADFFSDLPVPFRCTIVNKVSISLSASRRHRHRRTSVLTEGKTLRISLLMVEKQLQTVYPTLNITQKCSKDWKPLKNKIPLESLASLVNITVQLTEGTRRKAWVKRLRRKAFRIYNIYRKKMKGSRLGKKNEVRLSVIRFTKITRLVANAVFSLEIKRPGAKHYSKVTPATDIIHAIKSIGRRNMKRIFDGKVLKITGAIKDPVDSESLWTYRQSEMARSQFPSYLKSYFRSGMDRLGRCLVMIYIATNLEKELIQVESFYYGQNYLPKKYFCSSKRGTTEANVSIKVFYRANDTLATKPKGNKEQRSKNNKEKENDLLLDKIKEWDNASFVSTPDDQPVELGGEELDEEHAIKKITPLEIGLISLLVLLCVAVVAFTIHCVIFAFKKHSNQSSNEQQPKSSFALFKGIESNTKEQGTLCEIQKTLQVNCDSTKEENCTNKSSETEASNTVEAQLQHDTDNDDRSTARCSSENIADKSRSKCQSDDDEVFTNSDTSMVSDNTEQCSVLTGGSNSFTEGIAKHERQTILKESCGELRLLSDGDSSRLRSLSSSSRDMDPFIKNNTVQVFVVIDDRETST